MTLPNFFIIGAMKAGTTSLHGYLQHHPEIFLPRNKEPHFFHEQGTWDRGLPWYESLFATAGQARAIGEASTGYSMFPEAAGVPARIARLIPDARFVYLLRHPVERMRSQYLHGLAAGSETRPIHVALLREARYLNTSRYALQLDQYLRYFSKDQILVITSEALRAQRGDTLDRVLRFLGLQPGWRPPNLGQELHLTEAKRVPRAANRFLGELMIRSGWSRPLPPSLLRRWNRLATRALRPDDLLLDVELRSRLMELLREDLARLGAHLGPDFPGWDAHSP